MRKWMILDVHMKNKIQLLDYASARFNNLKVLFMVLPIGQNCNVTYISEKWNMCLM